MADAHRGSEQATAEVTELAGAILDEIERAVVGKRDVLELILIALCADGHVLIEDNPGVAKTLIARSFAAVTELDFKRIQFTPDLMPGDITGASVFDQRSGTFEFRPGPVFTNVLLCDEINRAPPKTQAALLEAMQERQITSEDRTRTLARPFFVLATQNPIEYEGTYPLPEAQLDRFMIRVQIGYPTRDDEQEILTRRAVRGSDEVQLRSVVDSERLLAMQQRIEEVHVDAGVTRYMVELVAQTRVHPSLQLGASPRAGLALLKLSRAHAAVRGRDYATPDDVKHVALAALAHRVVLRPELWIQQVETTQIVRQLLDTVPVPPEVDEGVAVTR